MFSTFSQYFESSNSKSNIIKPYENSFELNNISKVYLSSQQIATEQDFADLKQQILYMLNVYQHLFHFNRDIKLLENLLEKTKIYKKIPKGFYDDLLLYCIEHYNSYSHIEYCIFSFEAMRLLIEKYNANIFVLDSSGNTLLYKMISVHHYRNNIDKDIICYLLRCGISPFTKNCHGDSAIKLAINRKNDYFFDTKEVLEIFTK